MLQAILSLFPANNFTLLGVILLLPLLGAFVNGVWGKRLGREGVRTMALSVMVLAFGLAVVSFASLVHAIGLESHGEENEHVKLAWTAWDWLTTSGRGGARIEVPVRFSIDALSGVMVLVITGIGSLIHLYAATYMKDDPSFHRFFCYLNLFVFSMLVLVMGDNLPILFVGWEGVGLCSYLLIGFWYDKDANASAGKKAFITNRVGDFGLLCAMFLLAYFTNSLDWNGIENGVRGLINPQAVAIWPIGGGKFGSLGPISLEFLNPTGPTGAFAPITISAASAIAFCLLLGAAGKSAQMPLYIWLPDAMAGPTPVSALIHAATMVTAGVYLVCRLNFVFVLSPGIMMLVAIVGAATALFAATIALVQNDLKKVLAYSTVSQLGFMFLGVGMGAFTAGFFHVLTHAFFKACLFLGAGSVIHAMHARIHDDVESQDMRNMGGLRKFMPLTFGTFTVATAAIIGFPLTSGFFSKDEILFKAFTSSWVHPYADLLKANGAEYFEPPVWVGRALFATGVIAATLTAFYMSRAWFLTFFGDFRGWKIGTPAHDSHAHHGHDDHGHGHDDHHHEDLTQPGAAPHESPRSMTIPLIILGALAAFGGFLNPAGLFHHLTHIPLPMEHWLDPVFRDSVAKGVLVAEDAASKEVIVTICALGAFVVGLGLAYWMYQVQKGVPAKRLAEGAPGLHRVLANKWYVDEAYEATLYSGVDALADSAMMVDRGVINFVIARLTAFLAAAAGTVLRAFQTGKVHVYSAAMVVGLAFIGWFYVMPHAQAEVQEIAPNKYLVTAVPGPGYRYLLSETEISTEQKLSNRTNLEVNVDSGASKTVYVKVSNAFGFTTTKEVTVRNSSTTAPTAMLDAAAAGQVPTQGH